MTPATVEVNEVKKMLLFVTTILPSVQPVESDALILSSIQNIAAYSLMMRSPLGEIIRSQDI